MTRGPLCGPPADAVESPGEAGIPSAQTVLGAVPVSELGVIQPHEHIFSDTTGPAVPRGTGPLWRHYDQPIRLDNYYDVRRDHLNAEDQRLVSVSDAITEVEQFRLAGGGTIVDLTPWGLGRNPSGLRAVAEAAGVHLIMGCGYYVAAFHPATVAHRDEHEITQGILDEYRSGAADTGIRPGVIGEIGVSWPPAAEENKVLRAAARAQAASGLALFIHPGRHPTAPFEHLQAVDAAGGDVGRCVISHVDRTLFEIADMMALARTGCYVEFDLFGIETSYYSLSEIDLPNDAIRVDRVADLLSAGHGARVLISQDICNKTRLTSYGGEGTGTCLPG